MLTSETETRDSANNGGASDADNRIVAGGAGGAGGDDGDDDDGKEEGEASGSGRWWEQYTVRYFVGTVLGALILGVLVVSWSKSSDWLPITPDLVKKLDAKTITALGAIGLAYCYVASAPVLTFHAVRGAFRLDKIDGSLALLSLIGFTWVLYVLGTRGSGPSAGWIALIAIVGLQVILISVASQRSFASIKDFYAALIKARLKEKKRKTDYVDSYRHLREHGNALAIVFFELALGFILWSIAGRAELCLAIAIWVLPGAWCWLIGGVLERDFAES